MRGSKKAGMSTPETPPEQHHEGQGILLAGGAYFVWGLVPLYWQLLADVSPWQVTLHRILWCALFGVIVTVFRRRVTHFIAVFRTPKLLGALTASSLSTAQVSGLSATSIGNLTSTQADALTTTQVGSREGRAWLSCRAERLL